MLIAWEVATFKLYFIVCQSFLGDDTEYIILVDVLVHLTKCSRQVLSSELLVQDEVVNRVFF